MQHGGQRQRHRDSAVGGQEEALLGVAQDGVADEMKRGALQRMGQQPAVHGSLEGGAQPSGAAFGAFHALHHAPRVAAISGEVGQRESRGGDRQALPRQPGEFVECRSRRLSGQHVQIEAQKPERREPAQQRAVALHQRPDRRRRPAA